MIDKDASNESLTTSAQRCDECGVYIGAVSYYWVKGRTLCVSCYLKTPSSKEVTNETSENKFEYHTNSLSQIIRFYITEGLIKRDWRVIAIDSVKDMVVFERFEG